MPSVTEIRDAIEAKIAAIPNIGKVHDYERYAKEASKFVEFYKDAGSGRVLGWHVRRFSTREVLTDTDRWSIFHQWRIRGFMSLDDADGTEKLFDAKIEEIREAFRSPDDLGGLVLGSVDPGTREAGVQLLEHQPVLLAGVLCHRAEMRLTTQHLHP